MQIARFKIDFDGEKLTNDLQMHPSADAYELNELAFAFYFYFQGIKVPCGAVDDITVKSSLTIMFSREGDRQEINFVDRFCQCDASIKTLPDAIAQTLLDKFKTLEIDIDAYKPAFNQHMAKIAVAQEPKNLTV